MRHTLTKGGKTVAKITKSADRYVARLYGKAEGMVCQFSTVEAARKWAELETA